MFCILKVEVGLIEGLGYGVVEMQPILHLPSESHRETVVRRRRGPALTQAPSVQMGLCAHHRMIKD